MIDLKNNLIKNKINLNLRIKINFKIIWNLI